MPFVECVKKKVLLVCKHSIDTSTMKTKLILPFIALLSTVSFAQNRLMKIYKSDGSVVSIPLNEIDSITHLIEYPPIIDGYTYQTVTVGSQVWFAENLRTSKYANGDAIPNINGAISASGGWAWYNYDSTYENPYGKLYNWYAAHDSRNVCPTGWHVPTRAEWTLLTNYLGGALVAGTKLKSMSGWNNGGNGTNESGLNFLPSGYYLYGISQHRGFYGSWWSSSEYSVSNAWYLSLASGGDGNSIDDYYKAYAFSLRCLRD